MLRCLALLGLFIIGHGAVASEVEESLVREALGVARELRGSDNIFDQLSGAGTLVEVGDKDALQFLADNLAHPDWSMMRSAIDTLLNVQHPAALDLIYRYAATTKDAMFMKFLAESCASRPREDMGEFLMSALKLDDMWVRKHALQALALTPLDDKEARMRAIAEDDHQDHTTRAYAYYALMDTPAREESVGMLVQIAHDWGDESQEAAAVALGAIDNDTTRGALKSLREANALKVQVAAMASEAGFGVRDAMEALIHTIAEGKGLDPSVAAASLRRMPPAVASRITDALLECCKLGSDVGTRLVEAWGTIEADPAHLYAWALGNANPDIRMQAIWLVGERGDRAYLERIAPMLKDDDAGLRGMAAWSVVRILGAEYGSGLEI
ncbi:MAG: HEAT repeat domain-containing protein [Gammaproteobacteria bacterium]